MLHIQKDEKDNLLSESNIQHDQSQTIQSNISDPKTEQSDKQQQKSDIIDPIQQLTKNKNIMPLLAIIDLIDLNIEIEDKPLLCVLASKFLPLDQILKDREIQFKADNDKRTPLHYAIEANDVKAAAWCIANGNKNQVDNFGNTPILDAIRMGRRRCMLLLLKNKFYDERAPIIAATHNKHWQLKVLHALKFNIDSVRDQQNRTAFQRALEYCSFDCAQFMIMRDPSIDVSSFAHFTQSKGLIRKLTRIKSQQSKLSQLKSALYPILLLSAIFIGLNTQTFGIHESFPYQDTSYLYLIVILLILGLNVMMFVFGISCADVKYRQKNSLSQILNQPNFITLEDICPTCLHFTDHRWDHCYACGCCVQKFHFHSFVCVNKANQVFWILSEFVWLYLCISLLSQYYTFLDLNNLFLYKYYSLSPIKLVSVISMLYKKELFISLGWLIFLVFLSLYQMFNCLTIVGMMCMRRKYQEVIHSQKYHHLYEVNQIEDTFMCQEKKVFKRGFIGGMVRSLRNLLVYFFVQN